MKRYFVFTCFMFVNQQFYDCIQVGVQAVKVRKFPSQKLIIDKATKHYKENANLFDYELEYLTVRVVSFFEMNEEDFNNYLPEDEREQ